MKMADPINNINDTLSYYRDLQIQSAVQRSTTTSEATLGMSDFITLLVAQLQNQDMLNPMDNTEFIAQMATFSTLTAINNMAAQSMTTYAVSLLGKEVIVAEFDPVTNRLERHEGVVTGISLFEGDPKIYIGDRSFDLRSIMTVGKLPDPPKPEEPETEPEPELVTDPDPKPDTDLDDGE